MTSSNEFQVCFEYCKKKDFNGLVTRVIFDRKTTIFQYHNGNFNASENLNLLNGLAEKEWTLAFRVEITFSIKVAYAINLYK